MGRMSNIHLMPKIQSLVPVIIDVYANVFFFYTHEKETLKPVFHPRASCAAACAMCALC